MSKNTWGAFFFNGILYFLSPFSLGSQTLLRVNKLGPPRILSLPYTQNSGECRLAVWQARSPWPWVYLGTIPQGMEGPTGEQGNPFQEIFFHLVVYSIPQKPFQIQLLEDTWGLSVEFDNCSCNCPSFFWKKTTGGFSGNKYLFTWMHHVLHLCTKETRQASLATAEH